MTSLRTMLATFSGAMFSLAFGVLVNAMTPPMAYADAPQSSASDQYIDMCVNQATQIPVPHGEADLKGNPKLGEYCKCFSEKFAARAMASVQSEDKSASSLQESVKEERAMRNGCRKQVGLPLLKFGP
jgi:hypothetical protein